MSSKPSNSNMMGRGALSPATPKNSKLTAIKIFKQIKENKAVLVWTLVFSAIGVALYVLGSLLFGQMIQYFFSIKDVQVINNSATIIFNDRTPFIEFLTWGFPREKVMSFVAACINMFICYFAFLLSQSIQNILMVKISQRTSAKLRKEVFEKLQKMPVSYFDSHPSGDLMSRMSNDIDNVSQGLTQSLSQFIQSIFQILLTVILMFVLSSYITLITILLLPLMLSLCYVFIKKAQPQFVIQQEKLGDLNSYIEEMISGQRVTNLMNREEEVSKEFSKYNNALVKSAVISQTFSGFMFSWFSFITNVLLLAITGIAVAFNLNHINIGGIGGNFAPPFGQADIAFISTYTLLLRNVLNPIQQLLSTLNVVQAGLAGAERVFKIVELKEPEVNKDAIELKEVKGHVEFKNVNFGYTEEKLNLIDANINAKPGEVIAIVGPTGAGKTTIINLLTKFYNYNSGQILIDGKEINEITEKSWRDNISIVLQDTFLFNDTIRENIRYGRLDATDEEVEEAAKVADADLFIRQLEHGYDTVLSSDGKDLSQGQRQLLAIARAVISKSNILILDEATSSVDTRTELLIQNAMLKLMKGRTSFVIAHRLSTIKNADQILVINDGKIIEKGNHKELLKIKNGFYANLYNSQFKKGILEE